MLDISVSFIKWQQMIDTPRVVNLPLKKEQCNEVVGHNIAAVGLHR